MRRRFAQLIERPVRKRIAKVITADLGFGFIDDIEHINVGAAEHLMIGVAVGLAREGFIPVCYTITSFLLYRPFEMLRLYVDAEKVPVKLVGTGRGNDYANLGLSHCADESILEHLPDIRVYRPDSVEELDKVFHEFLFSSEPAYMNLRR